MSEVVYRRIQGTAVGRAALRPRRSVPARGGGPGGLYYAGAKTGYLLEFAGPVAAIVWLPVGVGIAFLYLGGLALLAGRPDRRPAGQRLLTLPFGSALGQTCGNVLEVVMATLLLRRLVRHGSPLASVRGRRHDRRLRSRRCGRQRDDRRHVSLLLRDVIGFDRRRRSGAPGGSAMPPARCSSCRSRWPGTAAAEGLARPGRLEAARCCGGRRRWRNSPRGARPDRLPRLSGADLGGAPLRPARGDARRRSDRGLTVWNVTHYVGPFQSTRSRAACSPRSSSSPSPRSRRSEPRGGRHGARALRHAARRVALASDLGVGQRGAAGSSTTSTTARSCA